MDGVVPQETVAASQVLSSLVSWSCLWLALLVALAVHRLVFALPRKPQLSVFSGNVGVGFGLVGPRKSASSFFSRSAETSLTRCLHVGWAPRDVHCTGNLHLQDLAGGRHRRQVCCTYARMNVVEIHSVLRKLRDFPEIGKTRNKINPMGKPKEGFMMRTAVIAAVALVLVVGGAFAIVYHAAPSPEVRLKTYLKRIVNREFARD